MSGEIGQVGRDRAPDRAQTDHRDACPLVRHCEIVPQRFPELALACARTPAEGISMLGYVTLGTNDFDRAAKFYDALLAEMGGMATS